MLSTLEQYSTSKNPFVLKHILSSFPPEYISKHAATYIKLIKEAEPWFPKVKFHFFYFYLFFIFFFCFTLFIFIL
jgi:hypothetical protein